MASSFEGAIFFCYFCWLSISLPKNIDTHNFVYYEEKNYTVLCLNLKESININEIVKLTMDVLKEINEEEKNNIKTFNSIFKEDDILQMYLKKIFTKIVICMLLVTLISGCSSKENRSVDDGLLSDNAENCVDNYNCYVGFYNMAQISAMK